MRAGRRSQGDIWVCSTMCAGGFLVIMFGCARWPGAPQCVLETPFYVEWKQRMPNFFLQYKKLSQTVLNKNRL